jgi:hypothetical protein
MDQHFEWVLGMVETRCFEGPSHKTLDDTVLN